MGNMFLWGICFNSTVPISFQWFAGKELAKANIVMDRIDRVRDSVTGEPSTVSLEKYVNACLEAGSIDGALRCAKYCDSRGLPFTEEVISKIQNSGLNLDGPQERVMYELQKKTK